MISVIVASGSGTRFLALSRNALRNSSKVMLDVIEVLSGLCLGEYDIARLSNKYGRC